MNYDLPPIGCILRDGLEINVWRGAGLVLRPMPGRPSDQAVFGGEA